MKKILICLIMIISTSFLFAQNTETFMMQNDGSLYTENEEGVLVWNSSIPAGTKITLLTVKNEKGKPVIDEKDTKRSSNGKLIDCHAYHVSYDNKEYYVLSDRVSVTTERKYAIISSEATIYRTPDYCDAMDKTLPVGTFITFDNTPYFPRNTSVTTFSAAFNQIQYFDYNSWTVKTAYVKANKFLGEKDDLKAIQLLSKISTAKDQKIKNELLNNLSKLSVSKGLEERITIEKQKVLSADLSSEGKTHYGNYMLIINDDLSSPINVRSLPGTSGQVIAQITYSEEQIYVASKTNIKGYVGDSLNYWYEIEISEDDGTITNGWVFGDFLKEL